MISATAHLLMVALVLIVMPLHAAAQSSQRDDGRAQVDLAGLDIQAIAGWDGTVDQAAPVPFSFLISNFSADVIEGQLTLSDPLNDRELVLGEIFIGPNSIRRFSSIQAVPEWVQCIAVFSHQGRILWRRELAITTGKDFSEDLNYLLFIDDSGRMLQWPTEESESEGRSTRFVPKYGYGRAVEPLIVKSWQVPQHPGPLTVAQAIVFAESAKPDMLNEAQWEAIAEWTCLGGTVFVHEQSTGIIEQLKSRVPLAMQPAILLEQLSVHRCGSGSLRTYSGPLFSAADTSAPRLIAESAARLPRRNLLTLLDERNLTWWEGRNADRTRMLVIAVFSIYTLLSGVVTLLLFRMSRQRIAAYTGIIVLAACVASAVLGQKLRTSHGDMRWVTVTQAGAGGLVQLAKIDMQSAGGRNTQVAVRGRHVDLQLVESESVNNNNYNYYQYFTFQESSRSSYPPFSWQSSLLPDERDLYQINVPMTPWGFRRTYAAAFEPGVPGLQVELEYQVPENSSQELWPQDSLPGSFTLTVTNRLPLDLTECLVVIGSTDVNLVAGQAIEAYDPRTRSFRVRDGSVPGELQPTTAYARIPNLQAAQTLSYIPLPVIRDRDDSQPDWGKTAVGYNNPSLRPRVPYRGGTGIWIVAKISRSSILSIEEQLSDFEPSQELHLYIQEIFPEDLPAEWVTLHQRHLEQQIKAAAELKMNSEVQQ